jgi:arylsulfatase A-like enzyme
MSNKHNTGTWVLTVLAAVAIVVSGVAAAQSTAVPQVEGRVASQHLGTDSKRPNMLLIVADDLGYSDLGSFGGEIATPNLDALAETGTRLTQFYAAPTCSPTRSMLMSGVDSHQAGLGEMGEFKSPDLAGKPGYEGYLNHRVVSMATLLQDAGYRTYMAGKWHLGLEEDTSPRARGFQKSFALLHGAANHFDMRGHSTNEPVAEYRENGKRLKKLPHDFGYSTDFYTQKLIEYIGHNKNDRQPFFAYAAFTAPHWPLQAPPEYIEKYQGRYDKGYESLREQRLRGLKEQGIITSDIEMPSLPENIKPWSELTAQQKKFAARKMEIYAAMVDNLDVNVGRLLAHLESIGELDNTLVFFMSDNGADAMDFEKMPSSFNPFAETLREADNSFESLGSADSYVAYGAPWAHAATVPYRLWKGYSTEGGYRVPAFMSYPAAGIKGRTYKHITNVVDVLPTFLDIAGVSHPGSNYKQRDVLPISGSSMLPLLFEETAMVHGKDFSFGVELSGRKALRKGNWKIVQIPKRGGSAEWALFNITLDPGERNNLASKEQPVLQELISLWRQYEQDNGVIYSQQSRPFN